MLKKLLALTLLVPFVAFAQTNLSQGGTGWSSSVKGDLLVGTTSLLRYTRLPIGSTGQLLWVLNGTPAWVSTSSLGITGGSGTPGGANTNIQFNNSGSFGGSSSFVWDNTNNRIGLGTTTPQYNIDVVTAGPTNGIQVNSTSSISSPFITLRGSASTMSLQNSGSALSIGTGDLAGYSGLFVFATSGRMGINASVPLSRLDIGGNAAFGSSYAGAVAAPTNGLIVEGNTGIGTSTPTQKLHVFGGFRLTGNFNDSTNATGTLGQVLWSTGTSTLWVSTSSLGVAANLLPLNNTWTGTNSFATTSATQFTATGNTSLVNWTGSSGTSSSLVASSYLWAKGMFNDSTNASGTLGQVLWSTGTSTLWVSTSTLGISGSGTTYTGTYPVIVTGSVISSGFSTSTVNNYTAQNNFTTASATTAFTTPTLYFTNASSTGGLTLANIFTSTVNATGQTTLATASATALTVSGQTTLATASSTGLTATNLYGNVFPTGLASTLVSVDATGKLIATSSSAVLTLLSATYPIIYTPGTGVISTGFSTSTVNNFSAQNNFSTASGSVFTLGNLFATSSLTLLGAYKDSTNATGTLGQVLWSTGTSTLWVATSSLGFPSAGTGTVTSVSLSSPTGLTAASTTCNSDCKLALTLTAGYVIPLSASTTEWATAYASTTALTPAYIRGLFSGSAPITFNSGTGAIGCTSASAGVTGCLTGADWSTFNGKMDYSYASSTFPSFTYASSTYVLASNFSGAIGKVARWTSATALSVGSIFDNGTVVGVNATSSTVAFNVQGLNSLATIFTVASSTGSALMSVLSTGQLLYGTTTVTAYGATIGTTTQFTAGVVSRVVGYSSAASTTVNINTTDVATSTIIQPTTLVNPVGTIYDGQMMEYRLKATTTQTIYWDTNFASSTDLTNASSVASGTSRFLFEYRSDVAKWELVGKLTGYIN